MPSLGAVPTWEGEMQESQVTVTHLSFFRNLPGCLAALISSRGAAFERLGVEGTVQPASCVHLGRPYPLLMEERELQQLELGDYELATWL